MRSWEIHREPAGAAFLGFELFGLKSMEDDAVTAASDDEGDPPI